MSRKKPEAPASLQATPIGYDAWLGELKTRIHAAQQRAALAVKHADDQASLGLLLCSSKNHVVAEYALSGIEKPICVADCELVRQLPEELQTDPTSIEEIERELENIDEEPEA